MSNLELRINKSAIARAELGLRTIFNICGVSTG